MTDAEFNTLAVIIQITAIWIISTLCRLARASERIADELSAIRKRAEGGR